MPQIDAKARFSSKMSLIVAIIVGCIAIPAIVVGSLALAKANSDDVETTVIPFTPNTTLATNVTNFSIVKSELNLVDLSVTWNAAAGVTTGSTVNIGSIPAKYSHDTSIIFFYVSATGLDYGFARLNTDGTIQLILCCSDIVSGSEYVIHFSYYQKS